LEGQLRLLSRLRSKLGAVNADVPVVSAFGAFGPGTGLIVAFVEMATEAPESRWRLFAEMRLASFRDEAAKVAAALDRIQEASASPMDSTFFTQAERWALDQLGAHAASLPDAWFAGALPDGRAVAPSGAKSVCVDRLAQAAVALAGMHTRRTADVADAYALASFLVPFDELVRRAASTRHPQLIDPFH
jgi:hypothetical protein